jgi:hypothetical protein
LPMRARDAAPATVRDVEIDGWGAMLANGLVSPSSQRAPIRRRSGHLSLVSSGPLRQRGDTRSP